MSNDGGDGESRGRGAAKESLQNRVKVVDYFDRLAQVHGEGEYYRTRRAAVIAAIAPELGRARSILDLGCGSGLYPAEFRKIAVRSRIVACDLSFKMLTAARQRGLRDIPLVQCDVSAIPFSSGVWS